MNVKMLIAKLMVLGCLVSAVRLTPAQEIPASPNVSTLNEYTFNGKIADGRVWFVEYYADWCRSCRRVAGHVSMLADNLTADAPHIVVARLDCDKAVNFCNDVIRIERTPTFKVYHDGKYAITYRSEFFFFDMMHSFITRVAADLMGYEMEPPPGAVQGDGSSSGSEQGEAEEGEAGGGDDDEYAEPDEDGTAESTDGLIM